MAQQVTAVEGVEAVRVVMAGAKGANRSRPHTDRIHPTCLASLGPPDVTNDGVKLLKRTLYAVSTTGFIR